MRRDIGVTLKGTTSSLVLSLLMCSLAASGKTAHPGALFVVAQATVDTSTVDTSPTTQSSDAIIAPAPAFKRPAVVPTSPTEASAPSASVNVEPSAAAGNFVPYSETMENAFSLMVPQGYKVKGGMYQYGQNDHRANLHVSAPDNSITLFMGDNKLSPYAMPDPKLTKHGFKDQPYEVRSGMKMLVKSYEQAPTFLTTYGLERWRRNYENVLCDGVRNQPALASGIFTIYQQAPAPAGKQEFTAADAHFHLTNHGKPMVGYLILVVEAIYGYGPGMWKVPYVWGYVSTPEEEPRAKQYLAQAMSSLQMTPQWIDKTSNKNRVVGVVMMQANHAMSTTVNMAP